MRRAKIQEYLNVMGRQLNEASDGQELIEFEYELKEFRESLLTFCEEDLALLDSLRGNPDKPSQIQQYLTSRFDKKQQIDKQLHWRIEHHPRNLTNF